MHKRGHGRAQRKTQQPHYYKASQGRHINYTEKFMHGYLQGKGMPADQVAKTAYRVATKPENRMST